ncbi:MAG: hypothetical protein RL111_1779 [Pseudomonadota bacterium]
MIPILTYHQIAQAPPKGTPFRSLCVAPERFAAHMRWLKRLGWQGMSMSDLRPYFQGERSGRVFGITFDDGYLNNLQHAMPVLKDLGFTATCYLVHDALGHTNQWDQALGIAQVPLMNDAQVLDWVRAGMEVGSHTLTHAHLGLLDPDQAWREIDQSKRLLEQRLGVAVEHFCYPYGEWQPEHVLMAQRAGYLSATTTVRGRVAAQDSPWCLPRVPVHRSTRLIQLIWKMMSSHEDGRGRHALMTSA